MRSADGRDGVLTPFCLLQDADDLLLTDLPLLHAVPPDGCQLGRTLTYSMAYIMGSTSRCIHCASFMGRFYVRLLLLGSSWRYPSSPYDAVSDRQYLPHGLFRRLLVTEVMADVTTAVAGGFFVHHT